MKTIALLIIATLLSLPVMAKGHRKSSSSQPTHTTHASKKSHASGGEDGGYEGGKGSSHKGGHCKNSNTHNHYRARKK